MSRPMVLVFMLILLVIISQHDWKQPVVDDLDESPRLAQKELLLKREVIKEKVILSQEKRIVELTELVHKLQEELQQCKGSKIEYDRTGSSTEIPSVLKEQQISQN